MQSVRTWGMFAVTVLLAISATASDGLSVPAQLMTPQQQAEARSVYLAACASVQQQFGQSHPIAPDVRLVLGTQEDGLLRAAHEVHLRKWDPYMFAQGVVLLAFGELMPNDEKLVIAQRAVTQAHSIVNVEQLRTSRKQPSK